MLNRDIFIFLQSRNLLIILQGKWAEHEKSDPTFSHTLFDLYLHDVFHPDGPRHPDLFSGWPNSEKQENDHCILHQHHLV